MNWLGAITGGWFNYGEDAATVTFRLHASHGTGLLPMEELMGLLSLGSTEPPGDVLCVRLGSSAQLSVSAGMSLAVELRAVSRAAGPEAAPTGRILGELSFPLGHIASRHGGSLYHMWLPLSRASSGWATQLQRAAGAGVPGRDALEHFDRALRTAARDPCLPLVCISLCHADALEAGMDVYNILDPLEPSQKAMRFYGLMQSHVQHSRLLQALYKQCRTAQQSTKDGLLDSWASSTTATLTQSRDVAAMESSAGALTNDGKEAPEVMQIRREIESTTLEANVRINQAADAIKTVRERIAARQADHERLRQEIGQLRHSTDECELKNERIELQLERKARSAESPAAAAARSAAGDEEVRQLRREIEGLRDRVRTLSRILEDRRALDAASPSAEAKGKAAADTAAPQLPAKQQQQPQQAAAKQPVVEPEEPEEAFIHLLPRPSELFAHGVLD